MKHHRARDSLEGSGRKLDCANIFNIPDLPNIDRYTVHLEIDKKRHARKARVPLSASSITLPPLDQINRLVVKKFMIQAADFSLSASGHAQLDRHGYVSADLHIDGHGLAQVIDLLVQAKLIDEGTGQVTKLSLLGFKAWKVLRGLSLSGAEAGAPPRANLSHPTSMTKAPGASDHIHIKCKDRRLFINDLAIADLKPIVP